MFLHTMFRTSYLRFGQNNDDYLRTPFVSNDLDGVLRFRFYSARSLFISVHVWNCFYRFLHYLRRRRRLCDALSLTHSNTAPLTSLFRWDNVNSKMSGVKRTECTGSPVAWTGNVFPHTSRMSEIGPGPFQSKFKCEG